MIFERAPQSDRTQPQFHGKNSLSGKSSCKGCFHDLPRSVKEQIGMVAPTVVARDTTPAEEVERQAETPRPIAEEEIPAQADPVPRVARKENLAPPARYQPDAVVAFDARGKKTIEALPVGPDGVQRYRVTRDVRPEARLQQSIAQIQREPRTEPPRTLARAQQLALFAQVARWMEAGLLQETRLPAGVPPFPEFQITPEEAAHWRTALLFTGVTGTKELLEKAVAAQTARTAGAASAGGGILARILVRGGIILALILPSGPLNEDEERNELTGDFLAGFEQRWWSALSQSQKQYLMELKQREDDRVFGEARLIEETQERLEDQTAVSADREGEAAPTCERRDVPRRGGHREHDAYATRVTGSPRDHFVFSRATGLHISYDGLTRPTLVWECKVRYWWWDLPDYRSLKEEVLRRFEGQRRRGILIARACGLKHKWAVQNPALALDLRRLWGSDPEIDVIR